MDPSSHANFYHVLGVARDAQSSDIRDAYRRLALKRHPDKNHGNPRAVANFQELQTAYETLYDEHKRRLYDAKCSFSQGFGNTRQGSQAHQKCNEEVIEKARVEKRNREWSAQAQNRASNIARLRQDLVALEATLKDMQLAELQRQAQENSGKDFFGFLLSLWSPDPVKTEEEKRKEKLEQIQQQTSASIRLQRAKNELQQAEQEHQNRLKEQDRIKIEESRKDQRAKAQREQEARNRNARAQAEAARAREAASKKAQDEARQRQQRREQQDKEQRERDLRQELLDRLAKEDAQRTQPSQNESRFASSARNRKPTQHTPNPGAQRKVCRHKKFWPKVDGRHECSICHKTFHSFVLQCPDCSIMACASCRKSLKGP